MNKVFDACLRDKGLKLFSIALAAIVWFYVSQKTQSTRDNVEVPLVLNGLGDNFLLDQNLLKVTVQLTGPAPVMNQLAVSSLRAEINVALKGRLPDTSKIETAVSVSVPVAPSDIRGLPPSVSINDLSPRSVTIMLDRIVEKSLAVVLDKDPKEYEKELKPGLRVHNIYTVPKRVMVRGPKTILDRRDTIRTAAIPVREFDAGIWQPTRPLDTSDRESGHADCLRPDPASVTVWIEVIPERKPQKLKNIPIEVRGLPGFHYKVLTLDETKTLTEVPEVEVKGSDKELAQPRFRAYVDLAAIKEPKKTVRVQFEAAPGIEIITPPPEVMVVIRPEKPE